MPGATSNSGIRDNHRRGIVADFRRCVAAGLQGIRNCIIPDQQDQANDTADFELVTRLVIKTP